MGRAVLQLSRELRETSSQEVFEQEERDREAEERHCEERNQEERNREEMNCEEKNQEERHCEERNREADSGVPVPAPSARRGLTCAVDTARQKRGFDSLTESERDGGSWYTHCHGDSDNIMMVHIRNDLQLNLEKKFDRSHVIINIGKSLFELQKIKTVKLSRNVINHVMKEPCGSEGESTSTDTPSVGDNEICKPIFCGYKRNQTTKYVHKSLPYKVPLKNDALRAKLNELFTPIINRAESYADLGSSQQCEAANKELTTRAPKNVFYGGREDLGLSGIGHLDVNVMDVESLPPAVPRPLFNSQIICESYMLQGEAFFYTEKDNCSKGWAEQGSNNIE
ncbi:hypothetical protein CAPTEDRAFT_202803 [Capitella teleta]|uniref:Uncharacterized protein n=1 Tax=Capitella teleta TaxID=283909 RepID=R7URP2_CAPTE|nr:hypothetical protein CAPTEDRAFT_202803 [Capitella teleta]|eukprot:ELU09189.1 hypothetical protein CAPTEDRAFT_202803 [Capitella teleta]